MISSSDPDSIDSLSKAEQPLRLGSEQDLFLRHYQQFIDEPSGSEMLWRVPTDSRSKRRKKWLDRGRDLLIEIIVMLIR